MAAREERKMGEEKLLQIKIRVVDIFYNIVSLRDKVKQIVTLPQSKAAKMSENRKDWEIIGSVLKRK